MEENIIKELNYMIKNVNKRIELTENDKDSHLIALGQLMALLDIQYSIVWKNWKYMKGVDNNGKN